MAHQLCQFGVLTLAICAQLKAQSCAAPAFRRHHTRVTVVHYCNLLRERVHHFRTARGNGQYDCASVLRNAHSARIGSLPPAESDHGTERRAPIIAMFEPRIWIKAMPPGALIPGIATTASPTSLPRTFR